MEWKWNADAFDAIRIASPQAEIEIGGTNDNEVLLEGEGSGRRLSGAPHIEGRWLVFPPFPGGEWNLQLPRSRSWVVQAAAASGEITVEDVNGRIELQLGSGDIRVENCRGVFNVRSGSGDVNLESCIQADAPARPDAPPEANRAEDEEEEDNTGPGPGRPPRPPIPPIPPFPQGFKVKVGRRGGSVELPDDWDQYGRNWEEWGQQFAEQAERWATKFTRRMGDFAFDFGFDKGEGEARDGVQVRLGSGDVQIENVDAQAVSVRLGQGDVQIATGRIGELSAETSHGEIQIDSVLPAKAWDVRTRHGDITLELPGDAYVRLDAATRHGDIDCDVSLVKVSRPGPGARHGGRMVGTVGNGEGDPVDVHLECLHGDIDIDVNRAPSPFASERGGKKGERSVVPTPRANATPQPVPQAAPQPAPQATAPAVGGGNQVVPVQVRDLPPEAEQLKPPGGVQVYDSQLAILQALQRGEITIAEAEMLLRSLK